MNKEFKETLDLLLYSKEPIIDIVTPEFTRLVDYILLEFKLEKGEDKNKVVYIWTSVSGLCKQENGKIENIEGTKDTSIALRYILSFDDFNKNNKYFFIFRDIELFYAGDLRNPEITQLLKDVYYKCKKSPFNIIFGNSCGYTMPQELHKFVYKLDMGLPTKEQILEVLNKHLIEIKGVLEIKKSNKSKYIELNEGSKNNIVDSLKGLTKDEIDKCLVRGFRKYGEVSEVIIPLLIEEKQQIIKKSGILDFIPIKEKIEDVGGYKNLIDWCKKRKNCFTQEAKDFGIPYPKGLLLIGVQGSGKSLICKAIGSLYNIPILKLDIGAVMGSLVGESESNIRKVINIAEACSPCLLFCDEIEKSLSGTKSSNYSDGGTTARVFSSLLTWLNDKTSPVFVVATANNISELPPELLRKGRFDEINKIVSF